MTTLTTLAKLERELFDTLNEALETFFRPGTTILAREAYAIPPVNIRATDSAYILELAIPGMGKKDIHIHVRDNVLTIRGERKQKKEEKDNGGRILRQEFSITRFQRSFTLPEDVDVDNISARYENGILFLTLPRKQEDEDEEGRTIEIR